MSTPTAVPLVLSIRENFGLTHERQVLEIQAPAGEYRTLSDRAAGERFHFQRSALDPARGFVLLGLRPYQALSLEADDAPAPLVVPVGVHVTDETACLGNGRIALRVPVGEWTGGGGVEIVPGPLLYTQLEVEEGVCRGRTFLDVRARVTSRRGWLEETGPLRAVACYRVELEGGGFYESRITLDADQVLATVTEDWSAGAGDQIVWDFGGDDFPTEILLLDSGSGYQSRTVQPHFDQRHARLWCWTQQTQLHDLRDGFALKFGEGLDAPIAGFVTLDGGSWQGNRLNHLEAWTRRWWRNDPLTRRGQSWESKADSLPSSDAIAFRGESAGVPHFNLEGWLAESGRRSFALVLTRYWEVCPPRMLAADGKPAAINHFQHMPQRDEYGRDQSLLRRIHIQRGLFSLGAVTAIDVSPAAGAVHFQPGRLGYQSLIFEQHLHNPKLAGLEARKTWLFNYLAARVYGFWEAGGLAYTNPVSSRDIAPALLLFEYLASEGQLTDAEEATGRAHLLFLATLFYSKNCYPGEATMQPLGAPHGTEPTLAGMANQNFFTDVFNTYGLAAEVFPHHPNAARWRAAFGTHWHRQLEYHVYPESGVWEESHTYFQHVLHTILPTCLRRRESGAADEFANPRFQNMVRGNLLQITPRNAYMAGARHLVAFGDHNAKVDTYAYLYRELAHAFKSQNPELAAQLEWMYREMLGQEPLEIEPQPVEWQSGPVQGLGYFFRTTESDGTQNLLALRSGGAWAHHHHDEGSIQFFAAGRALIVDAAFGYGPVQSSRKFLASGHSRWSPAAFEPFNFFWRFNRGEIKTYATEGRFPFAVAYDPLVMSAQAVASPLPLPEQVVHLRRVVQLAPSAFVVVDECEAGIPQVVRFQLPLTDFEINGAVLYADYPAMPGAPPVRLILASLDGTVPVLGGIDVPDQPGLERYSTREVSFASGKSSAILICAQPIEAPFRLTEDEAAGKDWRYTRTEIERECRPSASPGEYLTERN